MKKTLLALTLFTPALCNSKVISAANHSPELSQRAQIVIGALWESSGHPSYQYVPPKKEETKPAPAPAPAPIKPVIPDKTIEPVKPEPKKLSKGESYVQKMLEKNRQKLKELMKQKKQQRPSLDSRPSDKSGDLKEQYLRSLDEMKKRRDETYTSWRQIRDETYRQWAQKRKEFLKRVPQYKEALYSFEAGAEIPFRKLKAPLTKAPKSDYHIIPGALDVDIKDQGKRPTCASFSAIRAIETLMWQESPNTDLSEQYFYWASKPNCQRTRCSKRGSWVSSAFMRSQKSPSPDIPLENDCPYIKSILPGNETQIPLESSCQKGQVKVQSFNRLETVNEIFQSIQKNQPVIGGFRLSPNFYDNNGIIGLTDGHKSGRMDTHSKGHALLIVGTMNLPATMHLKEGKICFIVANSWGEGWGKGGFGCLTEAWLRKYRIPNAFIALEKIRI